MLAFSPAVAAALPSTTIQRTGPRADGATFADWIVARGYPAHDAALAFEDAFGGLEVVEPDLPVTALVVGPYACLADGVYKGRENELVPVMFAADDVIYSIGADGRGYACSAMVEGVSLPTADDGLQLLIQALLWRRLANGAAWAHRDGRHGRALASERGVPLLPEASSDTQRWWADASGVIVEVERGNGYATPQTWAAGGGNG